VDEIGKLVRKDKRGLITNTEPRSLKSLKLNSMEWEYLALEIQKRRIDIIHGLERLKAHERQQPKL